MNLLLGWIVDDDGGYTEDGREIFDEEMGDEADGHRSYKSEKGKKHVANPSKVRKKAGDANATTGEESSSSSAGKKLNLILTFFRCHRILLFQIGPF